MTCFLLSSEYLLERLLDVHCISFSTSKKPFSVLMASIEYFVNQISTMELVIFLDKFRDLNLGYNTNN